MKPNIKSARPFIGSENFETSSRFYRNLGFDEVPLSPGFSLFRWNETSFYLQDAYVKDWIDNTMIFVETEDADAFWSYLLSLGLMEKYDKVKLMPVRIMPWGKECFVVDPSGVLWHFGEFFKENL